MSWYEDIEEMKRDDAYLQSVYNGLWSELPMEARRRTEQVHCYPSRRCTYTIGKQRIFVRVRNDRDGSLIPECALRHIILHELGPGGIRRFHRIGCSPHDTRYQPHHRSRQWLPTMVQLAAVLGGHQNLWG